MVYSEMSLLTVHSFATVYCKQSAQPGKYGLKALPAKFYAMTV